MHEALWSLLGVLVGFILSEGTQLVKSKFSEKELREGLLAELQAITRMIPSRHDILLQAEHHLNNSHSMPTTSTHFPSSIYKKIIASNPNIISPKERDCLHVLYERLRIIDEAMDNFESRLTTISSAHSPSQAIKASLASVHDLQEALNVSSTLAKSVIDKSPINVYPASST
jgi:predicted MPP superfamily phosphohydrolase